jgi:hypothetical protein
VIVCVPMRGACVCECVYAWEIGYCESERVSTRLTHELLINRTEKNRTKQNRTRQNRTGQDRTGQEKIEQNRTKQNRTEENRIE